jgi:hypothetical protein
MRDSDSVQRWFVHSVRCMRNSKLVSRKSELNSRLCTTSNTHQGRLIRDVDVMDHHLGTRTRDMVRGMADPVMVMTTTPHSVNRGVALLHFPSWVLLLVVCC